MASDKHIAWLVNNLSKAKDTDILALLNSGRQGATYVSRLNFYSYAKLIRLKLGLTINDAAEVFDLKADTLERIEDGTISGKSATSVKYRAHLTRLLHRANGFVEIYFPRDIKFIFRKAYQVFEDSRQLIPYILQECLAKQSLLCFNRTGFDENQPNLVLKASKKFLDHLRMLDDE